ncbi:MAG TPA: ferredoxin reductase [Galbitalea sp.]|nr:ferredoxin reductase [Galbitalea sp.]
MTAVHTETPTARSLEIEIPGWPGNLAGQHLDLRLTAADGYTATRSYSIASAGSDERVQLAVDKLPDGEVSPYLVDEVVVGDKIELRGPLGGWFVWRPEQTEPVQLIAGGSGVVPLVAMIRAHQAGVSTTKFRLLYSVREPADVFFADELEALEKTPSLEITWVYTRKTPDGWPRPAGRVNRATLVESTIPASDNPTVFVCGPTGFVEAVADLLVEAGHPADRVKTERFGGA